MASAKTPHMARWRPTLSSSAYKFRGFDTPGPYDYSRTRNPTRSQLAGTLAKLEGGSGAP